MDCRAKFYSSAVFFVERWFLSLQDPIFLFFFSSDFSEASLS